MAPIGDALNYLLIPVNIWLLKAMSADQSLVGVYAACYTLAQAILPFGLVLSRACFAEVARATAAGHPDEARMLVWQVLRACFVATALGTPIALFFGDKIVACLYGSSFRGSGSLLGLLCFGMAAMAVQCFLCDMLSAAHRLRIRLALLLLFTAASIPTTAYLAKTSGTVGVAWALAFTGISAVTATSVAFHYALGSAISRPLFPQSGTAGAAFVNPGQG
jgi:O-antigen/teichoic acid export membrane protein